jgi:hypothetical protein
MPRDFFPRPDWGALAFTHNFGVVLSADPERFHIASAIVAEYVVLAEQFASALMIARSPSTGTKASTQAKATLRTAIEQRTREIAAGVRIDRDISLEDKVMLGLGLPGRTARPKGKPETRPVVYVRRVTGNVIRILLGDSETSRIAMPRGIAYGFVQAMVGNQPSNRDIDWSYHRMTSRTRCELILAADLTPGTKIWIRAFWLDHRAQRSMWSEPAFAYIDGGGKKLAMGLMRAA